MAHNHAAGDSGRQPRKHHPPKADSASSLRKYPVAQPHGPPAAAPANSASSSPRRAPSPPAAIEPPLPPWFKPLAIGLSLLTLAMACTLAGSLLFRGGSNKKATTNDFLTALAEPKNEPVEPPPATTTPAPAANETPPEAKTVPNEEPKAAKKEEKAAKPEEAQTASETPSTKTPDPKDKPEPKTKTEPKPKSEPPPTPTTKPPPETPKTETPKTVNVTFNEHVLPILKAKCIACHSGPKKNAGLDVASVGALLKGGDNGAALIPGSLEKSLLWEMVSTDQMPPDDKPRVTQAEKKIIQSWITQGKDIVK